MGRAARVLRDEHRWEAANIDLFAGDRDSDVVTFRDKLVIVRKRHTCTDCLGTILPGDQARAITAKHDGEVSTIRICTLCLRAFVMDERDGDCSRTAKRWKLRERREARRG